MARRATLVDSIRAEVGEVLLVDAGDFGSARKIEGPMQSRFIYRMMGRLGYHATALGPREVRYLGDAFPTDDGPPVVLANVFDKRSGEPVADRWIIEEVSGLKVGIFGLMSPRTPSVSIEDVPWVDIRDPFAGTADAVAHFAAEDVDVTVLLSQLHRGTSDSLLARHPEIDVVVFGHTTTRSRRKNDIPPYTTFTFHPGIKGQVFGHGTVTLDDSGDVAHASVDLVTVGRDRKPDPDILPLVQALEAEIAQARDAAREAAMADRRAEYGSPHTFTGTAPCKRCHEPEFESWSKTHHASAFSTLHKLGMAESADCLKCHTVGYGERSGYGHRDATAALGGVQCESCHGMGTNHFKSDLLENEVKTKQLCLSCHDRDNSPDFDFAEYMEKIRHW